MKTLRTFGLAVLAASPLAMTHAAHAQTHVVQKPETVVRAIGVYEWTGDLAKPTASRLVPVSVYINKEFEDAGVYLARPIPFALENGTIFELEKSGIDQGSLELAFARHLITPEKPRIDDGWFAYGAFKPKPAAPPVTTRKSGPLPTVVSSGGSHPHLGTASSTTPADPNKPVDRSTATTGTVSAGHDPDGPTMRRRTDDTTTTTNPDSDSAKDDPERPTLKKRTPAEQKAAQKKSQTAAVVGTGDLNDDPDRPNLHRGKPASRLDDDDLPPLKGVPPDMHQLVAVSDAKDRPEHDFTRAWDSPEERDQVTAQLHTTALARLAAYDHEQVVAAPPAPPPAPKPAATARHKPAHPAAAPAATPPAVELEGETVHPYTLSYGGAATYVYTAHTKAVAPAVPRDITIVAQREPDGTLKTALSSVTDDAHLDRTPQLRLIDAVDPDASNRASLLFELRGQTTREFALYRVIGAQAEQTLVAGNIPQE